MPGEIRHLVVTAHDILPTWLIQMQAALQRHADNAVSKTVNLPVHATPKDVQTALLLAYQSRTY